MRPFKYLAMCGVAAALLVGGTLQADQGYAKVTTVKGDVQYSTTAGAWKPLAANDVLSSGATIKAGPGAYAYVAVQNRNAALRVSENTTLALEKLSFSGADTDTTLNLVVGTVSGDVKKLTKASHFDIKTPNGVAGIRGTTWSITVTINGQTQVASVSVSCVAGTVVVATTVNGQPYTVSVTSGNTTSLANNAVVAPAVTLLAATVLAQLQSEVQGTVTVVVNAVPGGGQIDSQGNPNTPSGPGTGGPTPGQPGTTGGTDTGGNDHPSPSF